MCGICGFNWEDKKLVRKMAKVISHRGPDQKGFYSDKNVSLGHQRLSIIDLSVKGKQPMSNEEGDIQLVYNGEIYNFKEIRLELEVKGHKFVSNTDTEVVVHAYEEYGEKCVEKFNGFFSFAVFDSRNKKLFLARDRMGIKPLYYFFDGKRFVFASEIKAILEHDIERVVDKDAFSIFMNFRFVTGYRTMFKNIFKLLPGHTLGFDLKNKKFKVKKYWDVVEKVENKPLSYFTKKLRSMLQESVRMRLMSDVPLGVYLSGGIDSSTIVALMREIGGADSKIKTFSVGFGEKVDNEYVYARKVAEDFGTQHHEIEVGDKHLKLLPKMVYHLEEPIGDAATLPTYVISEFAKKNVTVVLAGEGADEQFAGYDRYKMMLYGHKLSQFTPGFVKNLMLKNIKIGNKNIERLKELVCTKELEKKYMKAISLFEEKELDDLDVKQGKAMNNLLQKYFVKNNVHNLLNKILYFDQKTLLPDDFFMKVDKMTMAHSVEERVPFLDHNIVEFSFSIPTKYKMRGFSEKYVLKKTMRGLLPKKTLKRPKRGYNAPMDYWLKGELKSVFEGLLEESRHKLYNKVKIAQMLADFRKSGKDYKKNWFQSQKLWSMLMFEMWYAQFIQNKNKEWR